MSSPIASRIYVGNINFNATEDELKDYFSEFAVESVEIPAKTITRGKKSFNKRLGFGFVQFASESDADNAIEKLNGLEFKLRQIYAKKALPPATEEEKREKSAAFVAKKKLLKEQKEQQKQQKKENDVAAAAAATAAGAEDTPTATSTASTTEATQDLIQAEPKEKIAKKPRAPKGSKAPKTAHAGIAHTNGSEAAAVKVAPEGVKSKTTVFVTNLDHTATSKTLSALFKDLKPVWVHVPVRKVPYHILKLAKAKKTPIYNKGIAFVKFADESVQLKAIEEFNGHEVNGKNIVLEVAIDKEHITTPDAEAKDQPEAMDQPEAQEPSAASVTAAAGDVPADVAAAASVI